MTRTDVLREISAHVRRDQAAGLWALGYVLIDLETEVLEGLLEGLREFGAQPPRTDHLAAFKERWGRLPRP